MLPTRFGIYLPPQFGGFRNKLDLILLFDSFWDFMMVCIKPDWVDTSLLSLGFSGKLPCFRNGMFLAQHSTAFRARTAKGQLFLGHWCCACDPDADDAATSKISAKGVGWQRRIGKYNHHMFVCQYCKQSCGI